MNELKDNYGRIHDYLRVSVTDRCNLRCIYCMPEEGITNLAREEILTFEEIYRVVSLVSKMGVKKVRITGGEPTVRKELPRLVSMIAEIPEIEKLCLTTNGLLLDKLALPLKGAGIEYLNISLDTLNPERFAQVTRGGNLEVFMRGLDAALSAGFKEIKLNALLLRGTNETDLYDLVLFAATLGLEIRFIEYMKELGDPNGKKLFLPLEPVRESIISHFDLVLRDDSLLGPLYSDSSGKIRVGFIFTNSEVKCEVCNRLRLSPEGILYTCVFSSAGLDLKPMLRKGAHPREISGAILAATGGKAKDLNEEIARAPDGSHIRSMVTLGG